MEKSTKAVIFGGTGFIGKHLAQSLIKSEKIVSITGRTQTVPLSFLQSADTAFYLTHIGASGGADVTDSELSQMVNQNALAMKSAFQSVQKSVKNFVFVSTGGAIYGKTPEMPIREDFNLEPISGYGKVKKAQEALLKEMAMKAGVPYTIVRPSNIYGHGQKNNLIGTLIDNLKHQKTITIFGKSGVVRDFLYIDCFVHALTLISKTPGEGHCFNVGTGIATPTLNIVHALCENMGIVPKLDFLPLRSGDVPYSVLNTEHFQKYFDWKPEITLDEGLKLLLK